MDTDEHYRMSFQEAFELKKTEVPSSTTSKNGLKAHRYMSLQPAWVPGRLNQQQSSGVGQRAYGADVFVLSALAAARAMEEKDGKDTEPHRRRHISCVHGEFMNPSLADRPFILDVLEASVGRSYATCITLLRQPTIPSSSPNGPFPLSDISQSVQVPTFTCTTTFKRPIYDLDNIQAPESPFQTFKSLLSSRKPEEWPYAPYVDIDLVKQVFGNQGNLDFPVLDMRLVDTDVINVGKSMSEKRRLMYYRLLKPLPKEDVNAHILCHAYAHDRNGLIMLGNDVGYGFRLKAVSSLSWTFFLHVNGEDAVLDFEDGGWWLQESQWPKLAAGKGMMEVRTWSPKGEHVATTYQDGVLVPFSKENKERL